MAASSKDIFSTSDMPVLVSGASSGMDSTKMNLLLSSTSIEESLSSLLSASVQLQLFCYDMIINPFLHASHRVK